jgi:hypothetical protein
MRRKLTTLFIVLAYLLVAGMVAAAQQAAQGGGQAGAPQGTAGQARPAGMGGGAPPPPFRLMYNCAVSGRSKRKFQIRSACARLASSIPP